LAQGLLRKEGKMKKGDKITFPFGDGEKEGTVFKVFPKTVYIKVDFAQQKGKIVKRSIEEVQPQRAEKKKEEKKTKEGKKKAGREKGAKQKEKEKKEKEKKKIKAVKEERKKEKGAKKSTS
jgi:hypothetical protein